MNDKLYNDYLIISTSDEKIYRIEKKKIFIHNSSLDCKIADIMKKDGNIYIIKEIYSYEDNRIRFSYDQYTDVKAFDTIEIEDGKEVPIMVIEKYNQIKTFVGSIGNITSLSSDLIDNTHKKIKKLRRKEKNVA